MALLSINPGVCLFHDLSISVASFYENVFANIVPSFMRSLGVSSKPCALPERRWLES